MPGEKRKRGESPASSRQGKRKRGAPKGNKNALKHGFYSDQFKQSERRALDQVSMADLTEEIALLRVQMHRYLEAENRATDELDYETRLSALRAVSLAADSLARLVRLQTALNTQNKDWKELEEKIMSIPLDDENGDEN